MLLTACDEKYLSEAELLIRSCARHEPDRPFHLFLVNSRQVSDVEIRQWHPSITIERVYWPYDADNWRGIMCCARSIPMAHLLERHRQPLVYLDSDTLVRKPLDELFQFLETYDLVVKHRPFLDHVGAAGTRHASKFNVGVIGLKPSKEGIALAQHYNHLIRDFMASGKPIAVYRAEHQIHMVIDQELLYVAYLDKQEEVRFHSLPEKFNDARFHPDSVIWHGKGTAREHPLYVIEKLRYQYPVWYHPLSVVVWMLTLLRRGRTVWRRRESKTSKR